MKEAEADDGSASSTKTPYDDNRVLRVILVVDGAGSSSRRMKR
jgi:hypothetical protein